MRVLAIDPGFDRLGIALLEKDRYKENLLYSNCFQTSNKDTYQARLKSIASELERLIQIYKPDTCALESLFFAKNQRTAIDVAGSRGVCMYIAEKHKLDVYEYTPLQIKIAVTGYGKSDKSQVTSMVQRLVTMEKDKAVDDEYDAIAVGLTCLATERF